MYRKIYDDKDDTILGGYLYNGKSIPIDERNADYLKIQALIDSEEVTEDTSEPDPTYIELRQEETKESMGGCTADSHIEYMYQNGFDAWQQEVTRIRQLHPEPEE